MVNPLFDGSSEATALAPFPDDQRDRALWSRPGHLLRIARERPLEGQTAPCSVKPGGSLDKPRRHTQVRNPRPARAHRERPAVVSAPAGSGRSTREKIRQPGQHPPRTLSLSRGPLQTGRRWSMKTSLAAPGRAFILGPIRHTGLARNDRRGSRGQGARRCLRSQTCQGEHHYSPRTKANARKKGVLCDAAGRGRPPRFSGILDPTSSPFSDGSLAEAGGFRPNETGWAWQMVRRAIPFCGRFVKRASLGRFREVSLKGLPEILPRPAEISLQRVVALPIFIPTPLQVLLSAAHPQGGEAGSLRNLYRLGTYGHRAHAELRGVLPLSLARACRRARFLRRAQLERPSE